MDRLTIEYAGQYVPKKICTVNRFGEADDCASCEEECENDCENCAIQECFNALGVYENLEVTPEQIREIDKLYAEKCRELADAEPYIRLAERLNLCDLVRENQRLAKKLAYMGAAQATFKKELDGYREAEQNGLLLRLPCKVGDTVFVLMKRGGATDISNGKVRKIHCGNDGIWWVEFCDLWVDVEFGDFGKIAFLSREEAEAKMAEMEGGHE